MVHRSTSLRRPLLAVAVVAALAGCDSAGDAGPVATPTTSGSAPSSPSDGVARTIPASAFVEMPADMRRDRQPADGAAAVPELCDRELAPGDGVVASAAMMQTYQQPDSPAGSVPSGVLYQTIRSYGGDGASAFLQRARDGLADCTSYRTGETTVRVRTGPLSGVADDALTVDLVQPQRDLPGELTGGEQTNRVVVMRFGSVVTILYDAEYERSSSDPETVDTFVREAGRAVRAWRG